MKTKDTSISVKMRHIAYLLLVVATLLNGCRENFMDEYDASQSVSFTTQTEVVTRGTPINSVNDMTSMGVFAAATGTSDWSAASVPNKMFNTQLDNNNGVWTYTDKDVYWEAKDITDRYTFFAYAPYAEGEAGNGITITSSKTLPGIPSLKYTVPTDVTKQPDLMVAIPRYNMRPVGNVPLQMKHALTSIGFQIAGSGDEKITGISISGVRVSEYLLMDGSSIAWTNLGAPANTDFSASLNYDAGRNYYSVTGSMSNNLIASDGYLMMIPQELGNDAKVKITFLDNSTREISLNTHTWEAGKRISYLIKLTDDEIIVAPYNVMLSHTYQAPASQSLTVTSMKGGNPDPSAQWTLTSYQSWLTLSLNADGSGSSAIVNGTGFQTVYLVVEANTGASIRIAEIFLNGQTPVVTVLQSFLTPVSPDGIIVSPEFVILPHTTQSPASQSLTVTTIKSGNPDPSAQWTLTSTQSWLWLSLNADGSNAVYPTISGTGSRNVYLVVSKNNNNAPRNAEIFLNGNSANVVTIVTQNYFNGIGQPGSSVERIYIDGNGGDPKLMLTKDPNNPGARFQFGGIRGWSMKTSGNVGNADYNPTPIGGGWNSGWQPATIAGYSVAHDLASLRAGKGDPCRLVGYTQAEIKAAIDPNNPNAYAPDNQAWKLPDGNQLLGFKDNKTTFPRHGRINENGKFENDDRGYYWSSWQRAGTPTFPLAGYLEVRSNTKLMYSSSQASGMCIPCISQ